MRGCAHFCSPHPQPLSHAVGEGCRGARRCALQRVPPLPPAGVGDTGGEGKRPRLTACMRWEKSPLPQRLLAEPLYPYQRLGGGQQLPHVENPLRGRLPGAGIRAAACGNAGFQWAPTLGGECYSKPSRTSSRCLRASFNGHPPLGVNATGAKEGRVSCKSSLFQWAPTLGGECYWSEVLRKEYLPQLLFQWAPTLGGECYRARNRSQTAPSLTCFNGHPPLGVNATPAGRTSQAYGSTRVSMGTHPWG